MKAAAQARARFIRLESSHVSRLRAQLATEPEPDQADTSMKPTILIVDDEAGVRSALSGVLRDEGYDVEAVDERRGLPRSRDRARRTTSSCSTSGCRAWTAWRRWRGCASGGSTRRS